MFLGNFFSLTGYAAGSEEDHSAARALVSLAEAPQAVAPARASFEKMPEELMAHILSFLNPRDLKNVRLVSRQFYRASQRVSYGITLTPPRLEILHSERGKLFTFGIITSIKGDQLQDLMGKLGRVLPLFP